MTLIGGICCHKLPDNCKNKYKKHKNLRHPDSSDPSLHSCLPLHLPDSWIQSPFKHWNSTDLHAIIKIVRYYYLLSMSLAICSRKVTIKQAFLHCACLFICLFVHSFIHLFICSFVCLWLDSNFNIKEF